MKGVVSLWCRGEWDIGFAVEPSLDILLILILFGLVTFAYPQSFTVGDCGLSSGTMMSHIYLRLFPFAKAAIARGSRLALCR